MANLASSRVRPQPLPLGCSPRSSGSRSSSQETSKSCSAAACAVHKGKTTRRDSNEKTEYGEVPYLQKIDQGLYILTYIRGIPVEMAGEGYFQRTQGSPELGTVHGVLEGARPGLFWGHR